MDIVACIKQVPDPETPATDYNIDPEEKKIILPNDVELVISPFDANAVEAGIQLKEELGGTMTVISLATTPGPEVIRDLRHTLAMGADHAVMLDDPVFEGGDSHSTAYSLAMAIKKLGDYDLILCGRQAADWDAGQVALGIAEMLSIPAATPVRKIEAGEGCVRVECIIDGGYEVLELPLPSVLAVSNEANMPRIPALGGIKRAAKKEIPSWVSTDMGADVERIGVSGTRTTIESLEIPQYDSICEFITGEDFDEAAVNLVMRLREEKII